MAEPRPSRRSLVALDFLNVFLADVRDGLGPFLAILLTAEKRWSYDRAGLAMAAMTVGTVAAQTPIGGLLDAIRQKRWAIVAAALVVALGCVAMERVPNFPVVMTSQVVLGVAAAVFPPAIAAITLGLVGRHRMAVRTGRNEAFNHGGNVLAAALAGAAGHWLGYGAIFYLVALMAVGSAASVLAIREEEIDHDLARGADSDSGPSGAVEGLAMLARDRRLLVFVASVLMFHLANAAMLPLVGEKVTHGRKDGGSVLMAACIITAQLVMIPVAIASSRLAESWGRKPVFLIGFLVLPVRGLLYTLGMNPAFLVPVQLLDGIGAGIFGVVSVLVAADLTRGTGRFNLAQGAIATASGLGAALSNAATGVVVKHFGFDAGFLSLSIAAGVALAFYSMFMPETRRPENKAGLSVRAGAIGA